MARLFAELGESFTGLIATGVRCAGNLGHHVTKGQPAHPRSPSPCLMSTACGCAATAFVQRCRSITRSPCCMPGKEACSMQQTQGQPAPALTDTCCQQTLERLARLLLCAAHSADPTKLAQAQHMVAPHHVWLLTPAEWGCPQKAKARSLAAPCEVIRPVQICQEAAPSTAVRAGTEDAMKPVQALLEVAAYPDDGICAISYTFWHRLSRRLTSSFDSANQQQVHLQAPQPSVHAGFFIHLGHEGPRPRLLGCCAARPPCLHDLTDPTWASMYPSMCPCIWPCRPSPRSMMLQADRSRLKASFVLAAPL